MYQVLEFNEDNFAHCLHHEKYTSVGEIRSKKHFDYFLRYLNDIQVKTIVIEENYVSKDYLHDFTAYYSLCFEGYPKVCKRIHFFQLEFDEKVFDHLITYGSHELSIKESYLGFIVVKPIPNSVIGFTVLKTYDNSTSSSFDARNFWGTKNYPVNLFGIPLEVRSSLAFQEQDSVVSACATAAIWSMLHGAVKNSNHSITLKTPAQITSDAGSPSDGNRVFPNHGLEIRQIGEAILRAGLVCDIRSIDDGGSWLLDEEPENTEAAEDISEGQIEEKHTDSLKNDRVPKEYIQKIINAYSGVGIPIILILSISEQEEHDYHAITVAGFVKKKPIAIEPKTAMSFLASNIYKFYAHDDQWGPFVRLRFREDNLLSTTWSEIDGCDVAVTAIIIPLYPKIRISYVDIEPLVRGYDTLLSLFLNKYIKKDLVWDIRVLLNQNYKEELQLELNPPSDYPEKLHLLTQSLPKYLWVADCYIAENKFLQIIFDATGVSQAMLGLQVIIHNDDLKSLIIDALEQNKNEESFNVFEHHAGEKYYNFLLDELKR